MKRFLTIIVCIMLLSATATPLCAFATGMEIEAFFDATNSLFVFSGRLEYTNASPVTVCISPYKDDIPMFSPESLPDVIQYFPVDAGGFFSGSIALSNDLSSGKYNAYFYYDKSDSERSVYSLSFHFVSDIDSETDSIVSSINRCTSPAELVNILQSGSNAEKLGIEKSLIDKYAYDASKIILSQKVKDFTPKSFYNAAYNAFAACEMQSDASVAECIKKYGVYFGTSYNEYMSTTDEFREVLDELLKEADYISAPVSEVYSNMYLTAEVKSTLSWSYLRTVVLENFEPISKYYSIPEKQRYKVFSAMFDKRHEYTSPEDIQNSFDVNIQKVYDELNSESGKNSGKGSGSTGSGSSSISSDKNVLIPSVISPSPAFYDISGHFCQDAVTALFESNIVSGYPDNTYKPNNYVTRAEFSKLIVSALKTDGALNTEAAFDDVGENDWFSPYVYTLSKNNIITGYNNMFYPHNNITREDTALIIYRVLESRNAINRGAYSFEDSALVSDYAKTAVESIANVGIVQGDGTSFYPKASLTRGEAAIIIYNTLEYLK